MQCSNFNQESSSTRFRDGEAARTGFGLDSGAGRGSDIEGVPDGAGEDVVNAAMYLANFLEVPPAQGTYTFSVYPRH